MFDYIYNYKTVRILNINININIKLIKEVYYLLARENAF